MEIVELGSEEQKREVLGNKRKLKGKEYGLRRTKRGKIKGLNGS